MNLLQEIMFGQSKVKDFPSPKTEIISRMEANQTRFGQLQLTDTPPESERQILRCAPPFDAQSEHEKDLEYESRVDYESLQRDGCDGREEIE